MNKQITRPKLLLLIGLPVIIGLTALFGMPQSFFISDNNTQIKKNDGELVFVEQTHDFGEFTEGQIVEYRFEFDNIGDTAVTISNVRVQCGCTTPAYSKDPIKPKGSGFIDVKYNSNGRPGAFNKNIFIDNDGNPSVLVLTIKGFAKPAPLEGKDLSSQGGLLFSEGVIEFRNWDKTQLFGHILKVQNTSDAPIKILSSDAPDYVKISYPPYSILPSEKINIRILFESKGLKSGKLEIPITFKTNDKTQPDKKILLKGVLLGEDHSSLGTPSVEFEKTYIDLGDVIQHDVVSVAFAFKNVGAKLLKITDVEPSCGCTVVDSIKGSYKHQESDLIKVKFDAEEKYGIIRKEILVKTNDPAKPEVQLVLEANVIEHPDKAVMAAMREKMGSNSSIFEGSCRSCHVDRGVGKFGKELYAASCQMCHGQAGKDDGEHHPGTVFTKQWLASSSAKTLQTIIAEGTPNEKKKGMMPGFQTEFGGPLTQKQVQSLVAFLKSIPNS